MAMRICIHAYAQLEKNPNGHLYESDIGSAPGLSRGANSKDLQKFRDIDRSPNFF